MRFSRGDSARLSLRALLRRREGSVAPIFAVAIVPVIIAAGVGIDLSRAMSSRQNLQDALDATALALAHLPSDMSQEALDEKANAWLTANLSDGAMTPPKLTVSRAKGVLELTAESKVQTTLTAISGYKEMPIKVQAVVKWGGKAEVVLVLDNTGSMSGKKLKRLKDAAKELVEALEAQASSSEEDSLRLGLVPFSMTVRLADSEADLNTYRTATWMSGALPAAYGDHGRDMFFDEAGHAVTGTDRFTLFSNISQSWAGCVESRPDPYDISDTAPSKTEPASLFVPYFAPDEPDEEALQRPGKGHYTSVNDYLDDEKDEDDAKDAVGNNSRFDQWLFLQGFNGKYDEPVAQHHLNDGRGPNAGCTLEPILRLTPDAETVKDRLENMTAVGNTNIPMGLVWGWHVLSPNLPFADGKPYTDLGSKKFIVLLTDGDNVLDDSDNPNHSKYSGAGYAWQRRIVDIDENASQNARTLHMDKRLEKLCTAIKAKKITVYAVRIDVSGKAPKALSECPTQPEMFYDIDSTDLSDAFKDIAGSIGKLRIAQ